MEWVPTESALVVRLAMLALTAALPRVVEPSLKVMLPVACPPYGGVIVAVKITDWPNPEGLTLEETASAELDLLIVI